MKEHTRIDCRSPDSSANPYLALACCIKAGLEGIKGKVNPPRPVEGNIYEMSSDERKEMGIRLLPGNLGEAVTALEEDTVIKRVLGDHISERFIKAKRAEFADYLANVSQWEIDEYLYKI
jgi:glutamine synthetase